MGLLCFGLGCIDSFMLLNLMKEISSAIILIMQSGATPPGSKEMSPDWLM